MEREINALTRLIEHQARERIETRIGEDAATSPTTELVDDEELSIAEPPRKHST